MEPKARSKGEIMMLRRQAAEDRRMTYEHVKAADRKAFSTAQWQEKTDKKVAEQNITRRFNALRTQQQEAVGARRQKLAGLLAAENEQYANEILAMQETPEYQEMKAKEEVLHQRWETRGRQVQFPAAV